mmetsp:Transcript_21136/g.34970  ORF Transcript_21136/g.34970 Transcript_21136/m.34970 type:complete len:251 (+) Transcript_21136:857-1609(+)
MNSMLDDTSTSEADWAVLRMTVAVPEAGAVPSMVAAYVYMSYGDLSTRTPLSNEMEMEKVVSGDAKLAVYGQDRSRPSPMVVDWPWSWLLADFRRHSYVAKPKVSMTFRLRAMERDCDRSYCIESAERPMISGTYVGLGVREEVGVLECVGEEEWVLVGDGDAVGVGEDEGVGLDVGVRVWLEVGVFVRVAVGLYEGVSDGEGVKLYVGVSVTDGVGNELGVFEGEGVGEQVGPPNAFANTPDFVEDRSA